MSDVEAIVSMVASARKYRSLCEDTIRRAAERELARDPGVSLRAAVKSTKRRLHQAYGAFEREIDYDGALHFLAEAYQAGPETRIQAACRQVMELHQSTRERLPILDRFYAGIWAITGRPHSILDLGCGLNPLALPWMGLERGSRYIAVDVNRERARFLSVYLAMAGMEAAARCQDVLVHPPGDAADVALLLKMSPTLERQQTGATGRLIEALRAQSVVVSFSARSLCGREKGMRDHYQRQFLDLADEKGWSVVKLAFDSELVFVVRSEG